MFVNSEFKAVTRFLVTAFLFYIGWFLFHDQYLLKHTTFVQSIISFETKLSVIFLNMFSSTRDYLAVSSTILVNEKKALRVGEECTGLVLFALFAGFIICYPGKWKDKAWFIPLGIFIIFAVNILRIILLTINFRYYRSSFAFNHHVTFTYTVYAIIFFMWIIWVNKISKGKSNVA